MPDPVFFFREEDANYKELSQWYKCAFTVPASSLDYLTTAIAHATPTLSFSSAEQYMMYCKAAFFNDPGTAAAILRTSSPRKQKSLGRKVEGFDAARWDAVREEVVERGNRAKFAQVPHCRAVLLGTQERELHEASPFDRVWGIGFGEADALRSRKAWGQSLLGKALMRVRTWLREEEAQGRLGEEKGMQTTETTAENGVGS
jgi:ribA/ribD-fused uncharacterized protein